MHNNFVCDEEKSYNEWQKHNEKYLVNNQDFFAVIKKAYMDGFAAGFVHKQKISAEEYLQK